MQVDRVRQAAFPPDLACLGTDICATSDLYMGQADLWASQRLCLKSQLDATGLRGLQPTPSKTDEENSGLRNASGSSQRRARRREAVGYQRALSRRPISGCSVSAITPDGSKSSKVFDLRLQSAQGSTFGVERIDDPNKFVEIEAAKTDEHGSYTFKQLGADRYFVLARCQEPERDGEPPRSSWAPIAYPSAGSIGGAQEIVLLPGQHRLGIDFHMHRKRTYVLEGKVIFSDRSAPKPSTEAIYSHDLQMFRTDRGLTSTWLGREIGNWNANAGTFRCHSLLPGTYTLYFDLSGGPGTAWNPPMQFAKASYTIQATARQLPLTVQLQTSLTGRI